MDKWRSLEGESLGGYVLGRVIGRGGHGAAYMALDPGLGRPCVVKVLLRSAPVQEMSEATIAALLNHSWSVQVFAVGSDPDRGLLWIAMELVNGTTLDVWLRDHGPMPLEQLVPFFDRVGEVVHAMHDRGIVHRDIKPSNIMVVEAAGRLSPKLLDFSVAKLMDDDGSVTRTPRGTPAYMSPEQWRGDPPRPSCDIYALGLVLYELITGQRAYPADPQLGLAAQRRRYAEQHRSAPVPRLGPDHSAALNRVLATALAKDPPRRPSSATELANAVGAATGITGRAPAVVADGKIEGNLRDAAHTWARHGKPRDLLWPDGMLRAVERQVAVDQLDDVQLGFLGAGRRVTKFRRRARLGAVMAVVALVIAGVEWRSAVRADAAREIAAESVTLAEVEQGRQALLHGELAEAAQHLGEAHRRGDRSAGTEFMLARATDPQRAELQRLAAAAGRVWSANWSPDGRQIVTTDDTAARIWEGDRLVRTLPHGDTVYDARWLPGGELATVCGDGSVRIWRAASDQVELVLPGPGGRLTALAVAPDGGSIAAMDTDGRIARVWSRDHALIADVQGDGAGKPALAYAPDGRHLAVTGGDTVQVYDTASWTAAARLAGDRVRGLAWSPDGRALVTGGADGDVSTWTIPGGARARRLVAGGEPIAAVAWSSDGRRIAAARRGAVTIWTAAASPERVATDEGYPVSMEFDTRGGMLAIGEDDGDVALVDVAAALPVARFAAGGLVRSARFSHDGAQILSASWGGAASAWSTARPYERSRSTSPASIGASLASGGEAAVRLADGRVARIDERPVLQLLADGAREPAAEVPLAAPAQGLRAAGDRLLVLPSLSAPAGAPPELVDLRANRVIARLDVGTARVLGARFVDGGATILTASNDGVIALWSAATGERLQSFHARTQFFDATATSSLVAAGAASGIVWVFDRHTGLAVWRLQAHRDTIDGVELHGDELVTHAIGGELARWSLAGTQPAPR